MLTPGQILDQIVDVFRSTDRRIVFGLILASRSSLSVIWECVVLAGWTHQGLHVGDVCKQREDLKLVDKRFCFLAPPLISKVKIEPPPFGKYLS
jgi:hypothetical protein